MCTEKFFAAEIAGIWGITAQDPLDQWHLSHLPYRLLGKRLAVYCSVEKEPEDPICTDPIFIFKRSHKKNSLRERRGSQCNTDCLRMGHQMGFDFYVFCLAYLIFLKNYFLCDHCEILLLLKQGETSRYFCLSKM